MAGNADTKEGRSTTTPTRTVMVGRARAAVAAAAAAAVAAVVVVVAMIVAMETWTTLTKRGSSPHAAPSLGAGVASSSSAAGNNSSSSSSRGKRKEGCVVVTRRRLEIAKVGAVAPALFSPVSPLLLLPLLSPAATIGGGGVCSPSVAPWLPCRLALPRREGGREGGRELGRVGGRGLSMRSFWRPFKGLGTAGG